AVDRQPGRRAAHDRCCGRVYAGYVVSDDRRAGIAAAAAIAARERATSERSMTRPPEDEITQQAEGSIIRAAWDAFDAGKLDTARKGAEKLGEKSAEGLFLRAACAREEDDRVGALGLLTQAIAADPEWASPELAFAELLAEAPETMAEARRHVLRAVELAE